MKQSNVALVGFTQTGKIYAEALQKLSEQKGSRLKLVAISGEVSDKKTFKNVSTGNSDAEVVYAANVDIVVICVEGVSNAYTLARNALEAGKHVITNNQTLMAAYGEKLWRLAEDKGLHLRFEGALLGGLPVMEMLLNGCGGLEINRIYGVLNSTCNYVLMRMKDAGCTLKEAIEDAVELGYTESDPELDISGKDSFYKLALLKMATFGKWQDVTKIKADGLRGIASVDIQLAAKFGCNIKLLAKATADKLRVAPTLLEEFSQLGNTNGTLTGIVIESDGSGPMFMAGHGNDKEAISSAMLADTVAISIGKRLPKVREHIGKFTPNKLQRYYVRLPENGSSKITDANHIQIIEEKTVQHEGELYVGYIAETGLQKNEVFDFVTGVDMVEKACVLDYFTE